MRCGSSSVSPSESASPNRWVHCLVAQRDYLDDQTDCLKCYSNRLSEMLFKQTV